MKFRAFIAILIVLATLISVAACGSKKDNSDTEPENGGTVDESTAAQTTAEPETTAAPETTADNSVQHIEAISLDRYELNLKVGDQEMPVVTMTPDSVENKSEIWESSDTGVATVNWYGLVTGTGAGSCTVTVTSQDNPSVSASVSVTVTERPAGKMTYIQGILIANKTYSLPADYNPGIHPEAQSALDKMIAAAAAEGHNLFVVSGFRSYERQKNLYNSYVARDGKAEADRYSSRPGHSDHQTGYTFDLNSVEQSFGDTPEGKWLAANCWKYGFIIRYPEGKEQYTGYMYEPWHIRYIGTDMAKKVYDSGLSLEEYLGITSVYAD